MKKILSSVFLVTFIIVGFTGQSWAFSWRHHGGNGSSNQGDPSYPDYSGNIGSSGNNDNYGNHDNYGNDGNSGNGPGPNYGSGGNGNNNFPTAPVPEPMTFSLLGTGLAGFFLKRKIF